jgi:hypothetical protein
LVSSGASQKPSLDMIPSISLSRSSFLSKSKIAPELFQSISKRLDFAF